ncbi:MAG: UvrB/UvrC motif-containing protein [Patescibacteria group bacterium]
MNMAKSLYENFPETPSVYLMRGGKGEIFYIGKAVNLKRRVSSYFTRPHDYRIEKMVGLIKKIDYQKTDTAIEALFLEAELIKKHQPPYNVLEKDDKSFLYIEVTKEKFPRVLLVRGKSLATGKRFGPFIYGGNIRQALKILRKIFPFATHPAVVESRMENEKWKTEVTGKSHQNHSPLHIAHSPKPRPCFDYQIGLCPGTCIGVVSAEAYRKNIRSLTLIFEGKKKRVLAQLEKEMKNAAKALDFEKAEFIKRQVFGLRHIQDVAVIHDSDVIQSGEDRGVRIEGYDISNISGTSAVGSMVVFIGAEPDKNEYRKFKIQTVHQSNDVAMLKEVLRRRFKNSWTLPDLILIDGGLPQVNAARSVLGESGIKIPIVGIAKGPERKKNEFFGAIPRGIQEKTLIRVRDEAHRFAISYYRALHRSRAFH